MNRTSNLTCKTKSGVYKSKDAADKAMFSFYNRNYGGVKSPNAHSYRCNGHWHWGHYRGRKK